MAGTAELRAALAEAVEESQFPTDEKAEADSWEEWDNEGGAAAAESAPDAGAEASPSKASPQTEDPDPEAVEAQGEAPTEYWGVSLEGIPDEARAAIIAHFEQQDSTIQKLQTRLTQEPAAPAPATVSEPDAEVTDEALLQALGFDPDDWETQQLAPRILPLARTVIDLEDKVDALVQKDRVEAVRTQWNGQLDELETVHGKLPFERVQVLKYAIDEQITSPYEVYFKLSQGPRKEVENAVAQARQSAAKKAEGGGVKPRSSSGDTPVIDPKTTSLRDAVAIAMKETEKETGLSFSNIFGRKAKVNE